MLDYLPSLSLLLPLLVGAYVYFAACLMVIANKTRTPNAWMAWIPLLNLVLMCQIGRKPVWWLLLMLVPLVNLVIGILIWMAIAKERGKSPALGILAAIPLLNLFLPLLLAMGPSISMAPAAGPTVAAPSVCPVCGSPECIGEAFCVNTGQPIQTPPPPAVTPPAEAPKQPGMAAKLIVAAILVLAVVYFGFGLLSSAGRMFGGSDPAAAGERAAAISGPVAGTLSEFPVDTAPNPARPSSVTTKDMSASIEAAPVPGGVRVAAMSTALYQARPTDRPVTVNVMQADPSASLIARATQRTSGGEMSGIRLKSAKGSDYVGYRVRSDDMTLYVLDKSDAPITVMITAPDPSVKDLADRLAANVGNGNGMYDDPTFQASLASLPETPAGLTLVESGTYSGAALEGQMEDARSDLSSDFGAEADRYMQSVRKFIPPHLTTFRYEDQGRRRYQMAIGDYGGALKSWGTWQLLQWTAGLGGLHTVPFRDGSALSTSSGGTDYLVFRKSGALGVVSAPAGQGATALRLAESIRR